MKALLVALALTSTAAVAAGELRLADLWQDTEATRELGNAFRIYKVVDRGHGLYDRLRLLIVNPAGHQPTDRRPAVVFIHGGGWGAGDPEMWLPYCRYYALRGAVGISVNYRLKMKDKRGIDTCLADCKSAIRYLRAHADRLGIDPARIVVVGESAGGHLAAALGTVPGGDDPADDQKISAVPDAMVLLNPITDLDTKWGKSLGERAKDFSPLHQATAKSPPTLILHGDADPVVELRHARDLHTRLRELGVKSELIVVPGAKHAFSVYGYGTAEGVTLACRSIDGFLAELGYRDLSPQRLLPDE